MLHWSTLVRTVRWNLTGQRVRQAFRRFPSRALRPQRRLHLFCAGTGKSGTNSIAALFRRSYRVAHEPQADLIMSRILDSRTEQATPGDITRFFLELDQELWLEVNSSQLNGYFIDAISDRMPGAQVILTIRNCYSWLDSLLNHHLARPSTPTWKQFRELRFGAPCLPAMPEEKILFEHGLYTLDGYLSYWAEHNRRVLERVPGSRLLVIRTDRISQSLDTLARFARIEVSALDADASHTFRAAAKFGLLRRIDPDYLEAKVMRHCADLMQEFFPDIRSLEDALPAVRD